MPITQARMLRLISAARDYQNALDTVLEMIHGAAKRVKNAPDTAQHELEQIDAMLVPHFILHAPIPSAATIASESAHFKVAKRLNERAQKRQERKRAEQGQEREPQFEGNTRTIDPYASGAFTAQAESDAHDLARREREANAEVKAMIASGDYEIPPEVRASIARAAQALASEDAAVLAGPKNAKDVDKS
jgi:hypothetical protein